MKWRYLIAGLMIGWFTASAYFLPANIRLKNNLEFVKVEWDKSHKEHMKLHQEYMDFAKLAVEDQKKTREFLRTLDGSK